VFARLEFQNGTGRAGGEVRSNLEGDAREARERNGNHGFVNALP